MIGMGMMWGCQPPNLALSVGTKMSLNDPCQRRGESATRGRPREREREREMFEEREKVWLTSSTFLTIGLILF